MSSKRDKKKIKIEKTPVKRSVVDTLKADPHTKSFMRSLKDGDYAVDATGFLAEIDRMHRTRRVRNLNPKVVLRKSQVKITEVEIEEQAYRGRLVEIKMQVYRQSRRLDKHIDALKGHLSIAYRDQLAGTVAERNSAIELALGDGMRLADDLDSLMEQADWVIDDIDQGGFTVKRIIDVLTLSVARQRNI